MSAHAHTDHMQRNASIVWARDLIDRQSDWVIVVYDQAATSVVGITPKGSIAVIDASGRVLLDTDVPTVQTSAEKLKQVLSGKEIVTWDLPAHRLALAQLGINAATVPTNKLFGYSGAEAHCVLLHYVRFAGDSCCGTAESNRAKQLKVTRQVGSPAASAARAVLDLLYLLAGSRQSLSTADTGSGSWTGAHYKPPQSVADKFKSFLGLN